MNKQILSHYQILGLETNATDEQINKAFKEKAKLYHPDKDGGSLSANEMFKLINEAKECLIDTARRLEHDYSIGVKKKTEPKRPEPLKQEKGIPVLMAICLIVIAAVLGFAFARRK